MTNEEIKERLILISALTEEVREGLEDMIVPFLLYGLTIPAGTFISYALARAEQSLFIPVLWLFIMAACQIFLAFFMKRKQKLKIKKATDRIFAALWGSIGAAVILNMVLGFWGKLDFNAGFFSTGLCLAVGHGVTAAMVQKKLRLFLCFEALCWAGCGTLCLFAPKYTAPLIIGAATFVLLGLPALSALIIVKRKKAVYADE
ncbi:hypothetical protein H0R92_03420 [Treponema sp. OMZ 840]|uniref:hypothetical protein n=1 Tax=Treponema sp. OMZ 840 TaxID=244313 RepID=UPI003D8C4A1B